MGGKRLTCNCIMTHSKTNCNDHEFIDIFFLVKIIHELLNKINPKKTFDLVKICIWEKYF